MCFILPRAFDVRRNKVDLRPPLLLAIVLTKPSIQRFATSQIDNSRLDADSAAPVSFLVVVWGTAAPSLPGQCLHCGYDLPATAAALAPNAAAPSPGLPPRMSEIPSRSIAPVIPTG